jgi:hypothetical protein
MSEQSWYQINAWCIKNSALPLLTSCRAYATKKAIISCPDTCISILSPSKSFDSPFGSQKKSVASQGCIKVIPKRFNISNQSRQVMGLRGPKRSEDETPVFEFTRPTAAVGRLAPLLSSQLINQVLAESETARPDPSQPVRPQSKSRSECAGSILVSRLDLRQARSESARTARRIQSMSASN